MQDSRPTYKGDWKCCDCGVAITELPFEPRDGANLRCFDCLKKKRALEANEPKEEKKMYSGDWTCSVCGGKITSLPFEPRDTSNLKCLDCFKNAQ